MDFMAKITSAIELLDTSINDASINSKMLASRMDKAVSLKREVELKEKAAEEAKEEAAKSGFDILAKVEALKQEHQRVKETNDMVHAREVNARREVLTKEVKELQLRVSGVLNKERGCLVASYEMHRRLKTRLTKAKREKELADKEKLEKEALAHEALAFQETQMLKLDEESKRLKEEAVIHSKLQDSIKERESSLNSLHGDVSNIHQDINSFIDRLDQPVLSSRKTSAVSGEGIVASAPTCAEWAYAPQTVKHDAKKIRRRRGKLCSTERRIAAEGEIHRG